MKYYFAGKSKNTWYQLPIEQRLALKEQVAKRDGLQCNPRYGCGKTFSLFALTVDHIIPISANGPVSDISNMQLLCIKCHKRKTANEQF